MTQVPRSQLSLPGTIKYFIYPLRVIQNYKLYKLHPSKSKLDSVGLRCVWKYINDGMTLNGVHNSLVDVKAQNDVLVYPSCVLYIDWKACIQSIDHIFTVTQQNAWKRDVEPTRPVHEPWVELLEDDDTTW